MDRAKFFAALRARNSGVFGTSLSTGQVVGIDAILTEAEKRGTAIDKLAYMLATTAHETAFTMQPIHERGQRSYFNKYEPGTRIGRNLGNTVSGDGYRFRGRGLVQITGRRNYHLASIKIGVDLLADPDKALVLSHAVRIMFDGMEGGWFTARSLDDYLDGIDEPDAEDLREFILSRKIINGTDKAEKIGRYALAFEKALKAGGYDGKASPAPVSPPVAPPAPVLPPVSRRPAPVAPVPVPAPKAGWLAALLSLFTKGR